MLVRSLLHNIHLCYSPCQLCQTKCLTVQACHRTSIGTPCPIIAEHWACIGHVTLMLDREGERRWREVRSSPFHFVRLKPFYIASPAACPSNVHFVGLTVRWFLFQMFHKSCHPNFALRNFHNIVLAVNLNALARSSWRFDSVSCVQEISTWPAPHCVVDLKAWNYCILSLAHLW